jgi:iron complex outermembrane receptor protein
VSGTFHNRLAGTSAPINDYGTISQPKLQVALTPLRQVTLYGNYGKSFQIGTVRAPTDPAAHHRSGALDQ